MKAELLTRLFRTIQAGSKSDLDVLCLRIVEEEKKSGHPHIAHELEKILAQPTHKNISQAGPLRPLPITRRDSAPLVREIAVSELRHQMVLPAKVEKRFQRIEKEFAARTRLAKHGLKPRQRILLYGPPGCGKSLGAERLAWNTGLPLRKVRFDTLLSSYFGETMSNLRKIFDDVQESPCALFLDECDTLARSRSERNDVGEVNRITNGLLEMLEDFKGEGLIIAATNLDSSLDSALFRRFDEVLKVPLPGLEEVSRLLIETMSAINVDSSVNWKELGRAMEGMSGSEVVQVAHNSIKHAVLEGHTKVLAVDIRYALNEISERHSVNL